MARSFCSSGYTWVFSEQLGAHVWRSYYIGSKTDDDGNCRWGASDTRFSIDGFTTFQRLGFEPWGRWLRRSGRIEETVVLYSWRENDGNIFTCIRRFWRAILAGHTLSSSGSCCNPVVTTTTAWNYTVTLLSWPTMPPRVGKCGQIGTVIEEWC